MIKSLSAAIDAALVFLRFLRIKSILLLVGASFTGASFAYSDGTEWALSRIVVFLVVALAVFGHIFSFNDWCDRKTDMGNPKRKNAPLLSGSITGQFQLALSFGCLAVGLVLSVFLSRGVTALSSALAVLSFAYSVYPIRFKIRIWGAICWHFVIGWLIFQYGYAAVRPLDEKSYLLGAYFGIIYVAVFLSNQIEDSGSDERYGIVTFATRFGSRTTFAVSAFFFTMAAFYGAFLVARGVIPLFAGIGIAAICLCYYIYMIRAMNDARLRHFLPSVYRWVCCCIGGVLLAFNFWGNHIMIARLK